MVRATGGIANCPRAGASPPDSVSKKSFRHAVRIFKLSKKFKNTCRLNAKGAFCPLHTSPAALSQTFSARFFDSLTGGDIPARTGSIRTGNNPQGVVVFCGKEPQNMGHEKTLKNQKKGVDKGGKCWYHMQALFERAANQGRRSKKSRKKRLTNETERAKI